MLSKRVKPLARGFTSFQFYVVMSIIGIIVLVALQRYFQLAEQTQRLSFEIVTRHFNTAVYNQHAQWILTRQTQSGNKLTLAGGAVLVFSPEGWPLGVDEGQVAPQQASLTSCVGLWRNLLQNPPTISYEGGDLYRSRPYHATLTPAGLCHFEFITDVPDAYYFEYSPMSGQVSLHEPPQ